MPQSKFYIDLEFLCEAIPLGIGQMLVPQGFTFISGGKFMEVFEELGKGKKERAGYIWLNSNKVGLEVQPNDSGDKLRKAWFARFPLLNPSRLVWRLFIPCIYERRVRGYLPEEKIGQCETYEILDLNMGDTLYPQGTIAGQYEADTLSFHNSDLYFKSMCSVNESGGLSPATEPLDKKYIHITNPADWGDNR